MTDLSALIGVNGTSGSSGTSGVGTSGSSGTSGVGTSGSSGTSGVNGTSGTSGINGTSGSSGVSGTSGSSGVSGTSGSSGSSGATGTSGSSGTSGADGGGTELDIGLADMSAEGITTELEPLTAVAFGDLCYMSTADQVIVTSVAGVSSMPGIVMCADSTGIGGSVSGVFLLQGYIKNTDWDIDAGTVVYAQGIDGSWGEVAPSDSGNVVQVIGVMVASDILYFCPNHAYGVLE